MPDPILSATARQEMPVFIPAGTHKIFGVLTRPTTEANGLTVIVLAGGLYTLSINRNRLSVLMARNLAADGYHVLRIDLHGVGESTGVIEDYRLDRPFVEDLEAAVLWLESTGLDQFVLVGSCFGGRTCLATAPGIANLRGIALISTPVLTYDEAGQKAMRLARAPGQEFVKHAMSWTVLTGMFKRESRRRYARIIRSKVQAARGRSHSENSALLSKAVVSQFSDLADRKIPVLLAYGTEELRGEFEQARHGRLGPVLDRAGDQMDVRLFDDIHLHGFPSIASQEITQELVGSWLRERVAKGWVAEPLEAGRASRS